MSQYRYIRCSTPGCEGKFGTFDAETDADFIRLAEANGWITSPLLCCPDCNAPAAPDGPSEDRMLVVPLPCGAFTAYAPVSMTPEDWRVVQGICGAMAGTVADPANFAYPVREEG